MPVVRILKGLPASGKTTWAKDFCENNINWIRVSRDDLRNMRGKYWVPSQENLITEMERSSIKHALDGGFNVIVDATNLNTGHLENLKEFVKENGAQVEMKNFDTDVYECMRRDALRESSVGNSVIWDMYRKWIKPDVDKKMQAINESNRNSGKPKAIICDIDGTVAEMNGRGPFDWDKVDTDLPKKDVIEIIKSHKEKGGYDIIFLTGREGTLDCSTKTLAWIEEKFGWKYPDDFFFHIRAEGDHRKDSIIKKEIFEDKIKDEFDVVAIYDDRDQVISMWRLELGLTAFQVNYGNF